MEDDLWWTPVPEVPSVGCLLRHLEGNVRQWIAAGLGGAADERRRAREFEARGEGSAEDLLGGLARTVEEACRVIDSLDEAELARERTIQGFSTTGLEAIYHVVEHFGWHTGQIVTLAKQRSPRRGELHFYDDDALNA